MAEVYLSAPGEALDAHTNLIRFWHSNDPMVLVSAGTMGRIGLHNQEGSQLGMAFELGGQATAQVIGWQRKVTTESDTYWISPEMCDLLQAAYQTVPDQPLRHSDLPSPTGFAFFAKGIEGTDSVTGSSIYTGGVCWGGTVVQGHECVTFGTYAHREDILRDWHRQLGGSMQELRSTWRAKLIATGTTDWPMGSTATEIDQWVPQLDQVHKNSMIEDRRLAQALWTLMTQPISTRERHHPARPALRRSKHEAPQRRVEPVINVIKLRRFQASQAPSEGHRDVDWDHRWIVGVHWRQQWYPSIKEHRAKLILPYIKGPTDKELKVKPTVKAWTR